MPHTKKKQNKDVWIFIRNPLQKQHDDDEVFICLIINAKIIA